MRGHKLHLVKWVGWPVEYATWEPHDNVSHLSMLTRRLARPKKPKEADVIQDLDRLIPGGNPYQKTGMLESNLGQIGHFLYGDKPKRITRTVKTEEKGKAVIEVEWFPRKDGTTPRNSLFTME